jgi:hypothetical protein
MHVTREWLIALDSYGFWKLLKQGAILWIRIPTGQLCIEVKDDMGRDPTRLPLGRRDDSIYGAHLTSDIGLEENHLSNMSLHGIHNIFSTSGWKDWIEISDPGTILLGSLSWPTDSCAQLFNPFSKISFSDSLGLPDVFEGTWEYVDSYTLGSSFPNTGPVILPNGWTRYDSPLFNP